jgi:hypothetical protein
MMTGMIPLILTGLLRVLRRRRALVLENLALRHQLAVLQRTAPRPRLRTVSPRQNTPLAGQGRAGAQTGRAPRARPDRRDAHGRRPPSSRYPPGGVRSFEPAGGPGESCRSAGQGDSRRSSCALRLTFHTEHVGPRGMLFGAMAQALDERPQLFHTPGWVKQKGQDRPAGCPYSLPLTCTRSIRAGRK